MAKVAINEIYRLHIFPPPEGRFGREEAQTYIDREFRRQANAAHVLYGKGIVTDADKLYFILEATKTMARACTWAAATDLEPMFVRSRDWECCRKAMDSYEEEGAPATS